MMLNAGKCQVLEPNTGVKQEQIVIYNELSHDDWQSEPNQKNGQLLDSDHDHGGHDSGNQGYHCLGSATLGATTLVSQWLKPVYQ